jgi:hypothetical protein
MVQGYIEIETARSSMNNHRFNVEKRSYGGEPEHALVVTGYNILNGTLVVS